MFYPLNYEGKGLILVIFKCRKTILTTKKKADWKNQPLLLYVGCTSKEPKCHLAQ